jgi:hypothetical protein
VEIDILLHEKDNREDALDVAEMLKCCMGRLAEVDLAYIPFNI